MEKRKKEKEREKKGRKEKKYKSKATKKNSMIIRNLTTNALKGLFRN